MKSPLYIAIVVFIVPAFLGMGVWYLYRTPAPTTPAPTSSEAEPAYVDISVPPEEDIVLTYTNASSDNIVVTALESDAEIPHTFIVSGEARGPWYFEATFPVTLADPAGRVLVETYATAEGEWMTTEFVPFTATVSIPDSYRGEARLTLKKDNPSGIPANESSFSFPIVIE